MTDLVFLKLGGSLITDKTRRQTARSDTIARLAREVAEALAQRPALRLLIGHGAGSFGHIEAKQYGTRGGVYTIEGWRGYAEVAEVAARLNRMVLDALRAGGVPALAFQPSASAIARDTEIVQMAVEPIRSALEHGLVPLVHGDVAIDTARGGTIISTEDIFRYLARQLHPATILLAGIERGVHADYPDGEIFAEITPSVFPDVQTALRGSQAPDVTGGMESKVRAMLSLTEAHPGMDMWVFSGEAPGLVRRALTGGAAPGTHIHAPG